MKVLISSTILVLALGAIITMAVVHGKIPEFEVAEIVGDPSQAAHQDVKVHGIVTQITGEHDPLAFTIGDRKQPRKVLRVESRALRPEAFKKGCDVTLVGRIEPGSGLLRATSISTACPSRYEAAKEFEAYRERYWGGRE